MSEIDRLLDALRRAHEGPAWHGPALAELLRDVDHVTAAGHPLPGVHSIWEIVLHLTAWAREVARRLQGQQAGLPPEGDWPEAGPPTPERWSAARADLAAAHAELARALEAFPGHRLDEPAGSAEGPTPGVTYAGTVAGLLQHDSYHGGQIALLKKATPPARRGAGSEPPR